MPSQHETAAPAKDSLLEDFRRFVQDRDIFISPLVSPHRSPGRGLGIRSHAPIPPTTKLMHVPTAAILTWSHLPRDFMPAPPPPAAATAGRPRVHARLAAYLALDATGQATAQYGPWMATWPTLGDFQAGMPARWPARCRDLYRRPAGRGRPSQPGGGGGGGGAGARTRRASKVTHEETAFAVLPPGVTGKWATVGGEAGGPGAGGRLAPQQAKFEGDLGAAATFFPVLHDRSSPEYRRFVWAWCCVNTRCFYYWRTWGKKPPLPPEDRDEAMAMCPGMDFLNHTADKDGGLCCTVDYDEQGFTLTSPNAKVKSGEELYISYGAHGEDDLWVEYGFMLGDGGNRWDYINIDAVVFSDIGMGKESRNKLKEAGYEGDYNLRKDGVCWRTETAARVLVMENEQWDRFVEGTYADQHDKPEEEAVKEDADEVVRGWVCKVQREAENSIQGLEGLREDEVLEFFSQVDDGDEEEGLKIARGRRDMCLGRWRQKLEICRSAIEAMRE